MTLDDLLAAIRWLMENDCAPSSVNLGVYYDGGCGCCSDAHQAPPEVRAVLDPIQKEIIAKRHKV